MNIEGFVNVFAFLTMYMVEILCFTISSISSFKIFTNTGYSSQQKKIEFLPFTHSRCTVLNRIKSKPVLF